MLLILLLFSRLYWPVDLVQFAQFGSVHTHIQVEGYVTYTASEDDGDLHIRLCNAPDVVGMNTSRCIVVECIPKLPCSKPPLRSKVRVQGISRRDPEHKWWEVHPLESIASLP